MKLRFTINYNTEWGQSLHVDITYLSNGGRMNRYNLPMKTLDGESWTLETAVIESRNHPISAISYCYQVEDVDGKLLRREWDGVPRLYSFDSTVDYLFPDQWRNIPNQVTLYSSFHAVMNGWMTNEYVSPVRQALFRKTILFRVSAPQLQSGESLAICGNHPSLGNWNPAQFVRMTYVGKNDWILSVNAGVIYQTLEYKYVIVDDRANQLKAWEGGDNRTAEVRQLADGQVLVLYGDCLHVESPQYRVAGIVTSEPSLKLVDWAGKVGFQFLKIYCRGTIKPSVLRRLGDIATYARGKGVATMGILRVNLQREYSSRHLRNRMLCLERCFDAVSLQLELPEDVGSHTDYWAYLAYERIEQVMSCTSMLVTVENHPHSAFLSDVFEKLRLPVLKIHSRPENVAYEFAHVDGYPYFSMATISTPETPSLASWWGEDAGRAQRYFVTILHKKGRISHVLAPTVAEDIVARHLFSPSMLCMLTLDDICQMDMDLRDAKPSATLLMRASALNEKLRTMLKCSKRMFKANEDEV